MPVQFVGAAVIAFVSDLPAFYVRLRTGRKPLFQPYSYSMYNNMGVVVLTSINTTNSLPR
jgi:hypothetical protein